MASPPLPASTVMLVRDSLEGPQLYLVRRNKNVRFMGGVYVFPGGKVDPEDADPRLLAALSGAQDADAVLGTRAPEGAAHLVAAIRETLEEAGLLLGTGDPLAARAELARAELARAERASEGQGAAARGADAERPFPAVVQALGLKLDGGALRYWSHWITPPAEPRRFTARFYVALAPEGQRAAIETGELVHGAWLTPREALRSYYARELDLAPPTLFTLAEIVDVASAADVLARAPHRPVTPFAPELAGGPSLVLPGDPLHPTAPGDAPRRFALRDGRWYWDAPGTP